MRKYFLLIAVFCIVVSPLYAAQWSTSGRNARPIDASVSQTSSRNQFVAAKAKTKTNVLVTNPNLNNTSASVHVEPDYATGVVQAQPKPQYQPESRPEYVRDAERTACIGNNIGMSNVFIWAARDSNTDNYVSMTEDLKNPENNVCFVRVDVKSDDGRVPVSDISGKYFKWNDVVTCGSWVDDDEMQKRILDAKKTGRALATVGGVVGGIGLGVGAMEAFGNKALDGAFDGALMGQKSKNWSVCERVNSELAELSRKNDGDYSKYCGIIKQLDAECKKISGTQPNECTVCTWEDMCR